MRIPLALRIFLVHLLFTVGAGAVALFLVLRAFDDYKREWEQRVATVPAQRLLEPLVTEVGRALLLRLEGIPEVQDRDRDRIIQGLNSVLREIPSVRGIYIVDTNSRIQYSKDSADLDLVLQKGWRSDMLASTETETRSIPAEGGGRVTVVMVPIFDSPGPHERRRLGSLLAVYEPDQEFLERLPPEVRVGSLNPEQYVFALAVFIAVVVGGGLLVGALTVLPVRRLDRALGDLRDRDYRGGLDPAKLGLGSELDTAVRAINEMGGRLEAMDSRGREREALLATLGHSLEEGMLALDTKGAPVAWNDAARRLLVPEADDEVVETKLREAIERTTGLLGPGSDAVSTREAEVAREGEGPIPVKVTEVPFELRPGESGTLLLLRDLATLRKVETHLLEAGRFAVLAHLAGSLAHEIRNPLHSIGLNASVVEQYVGMPASESTKRAVTESLQSIQDETRRLTELLNNYLGMLRSSPEHALVDVGEVCRRVIRLLSYAALKSRVEIRLDGDSNLPRVYGVPDRLQQAILNLVLNSIQAMPEGGTVTLRTTSAAGVVRVTVADTGPGIPPGMEEQLFDTRVTTKPGGSGLGLPVVRLIAEAHGGSVWYRSDPGCGAVFTLVLPAARKAA